VTRLETMSRFAEPDIKDEPKPVKECCYCSETLYQGDSAIEFEGEYLCDTGCFTGYMGIKKVTL
jgi:hypothetical protein